MTGRIHFSEETKVGCLWAPRFQLHSYERTLGYHERSSQIALIKNEPVEATKRLVAVSNELECLGVCKGMTVAQARALVPAIDIRPQQFVSERAGADALRDLVCQFSKFLQWNLIFHSFSSCQLSNNFYFSYLLH